MSGAFLLAGDDRSAPLDRGRTTAGLHIVRLRRTVADMARSVDFYRGALGFEVTQQDGRAARLRLGGQAIELVRHPGPAPLPNGAVAPDPRFQHAAIAVVDMDAAWRRVEAHGAAPISRGGPQALPANTGGVTAFKFRDPDGHPLELIRFPAGVGDPRWQEAGSNGPALGIDHLALVVASIDASVAWLARRLDFQVVARGVNRGAEQDRLDGLEGVEVDVVALAPRIGAGTPHLELLRYRHPAFQAPPAESFDRAGVDGIVCAGDTLSSRAMPALADPDGHVFLIEPSPTRLPAGLPHTDPHLPCLASGTRLQPEPP